MAQPEVLEAPPTTRRRWAALGGSRTGSSAWSPVRRRRCARSCSSRSSASPRCSSSWPCSASRCSARRTRASTGSSTLQLRSSTYRRSKRTPRPAADARRAGRGRARGDALHAAERRCRAEDSGHARRPGNRRHALPGRVGLHRGALRIRPAARRRTQTAADPPRLSKGRTRADCRSKARRQRGGGLQGESVRAGRARRGRRPPGDRTEPRLPGRGRDGGARRRRTAARTRRRGTSSSPSAPRASCSRSAWG